MGQSDCARLGIPSHLHRNGRDTVQIESIDCLYLRHPPLPAGGKYQNDIPDYRLLEQSANSRLLNLKGEPEDVLYNIRDGNHHLNLQVACLSVSDIWKLDIPNPHTIQYADDLKTIIKSQDRYSFAVTHKPADCMFPHCDITALKNGKAPKDISPGIKTTIRRNLAALAESHREAMASSRTTCSPRWRALKNEIPSPEFPEQTPPKAVLSWRKSLDSMWEKLCKVFTEF